MENYQKMYSTLFNAITDALAQIEKQNYGDAKSTLIAAQQKAEECISQHRTEIEAALSGERSNAAPSEARGGSSKKEGRGPSLLVVRGCRGQNRNAPCLSLGGSKGGDSLLKENLPLCPVQRRWRCHPY